MMTTNLSLLRSLNGSFEMVNPQNEQETLAPAPHQEGAQPWARLSRELLSPPFGTIPARRSISPENTSSTGSAPSLENYYPEAPLSRGQPFLHTKLEKPAKPQAVASEVHILSQKHLTQPEQETAPHASSASSLSSPTGTSSRDLEARVALIPQMEARIDQLTATLSEFEGKMQQNLTQINQLTECNKHAQQHIQQLTKSNELAQQQIDQLTKSNELAQQQKDQLIRSNELAQQRIALLADSNAASNTAIQDWSRRFSDLTQTWKESKQENEENKQHIARLNEEIHQQKEIEKKLKEDKEQLAEENTRLQHAVQTKTDELKKVFLQKEQAEQQAISSRREVSEIQILLAQKEDALTLTTNEVAHLQAEVNIKQESLLQEQSLKEAALSEIAAIRNNLHAATNQLESIKEAHTASEIKHAGQEKDLKNQLVIAKRKLSAAEERNSLLKTQIEETFSELSTSHSENTLLKATHSKDLQEKEKEISKLKSQLTLSQAEDSAKSKKINEVRTTLENTQKDLATREKTQERILRELYQIIHMIHPTQAEEKLDLDQAVQHLSELVSKIPTLNERVQELQTWNTRYKTGLGLAGLATLLRLVVKIARAL